ncbi:MAG TPA: HAMP domain-containing sensor histidine kinase [Candidatus Limnocylindria bacterium]|nr:HAMP domain-containing sensor histidine kinase [Candidatus Limnocylindria bacterium]
MTRAPFRLTISARLALATMAVTVLAMVVLALVVDRYIDRAEGDRIDTAGLRAVELIEHERHPNRHGMLRLATVPFGADGALLLPNGSTTAATAPIPREVLLALRTTPPYHPSAVGPHRLRFRFVAGQALSNGRVVVWHRVDDGSELDRHVFVIALALVVALALPTLITCVVLVRLALRPLGRLTVAASAVDERALRLHVDYAGDDEFARLAAALHAMTQRLDRSFERLREYALETAHELRAPLSAIVTEADLALARPRDPGAYRDALARIESAANELHAITRDVLLGAAGGGEEQVDLACIVRDAAADLQHAACARGVELRVTTNPAPLRANRAALRRLANALIDNAVRYARREVAVVVERGPTEIVLRVADDGPGISPSTAQRVFERRHRAEAHLSINVGLGLTLAKEVVERYGGSIAFEAPRAGACALVRLPLGEHTRVPSR